MTSGRAQEDAAALPLRWEDRGEGRGDISMAGGAAILIGRGGPELRQIRHVRPIGTGPRMHRGIGSRAEGMREAVHAAPAGVRADGLCSVSPRGMHACYAHPADVAPE